MGIKKEIIYRCDSCKKIRDNKWEWVAFTKPRMGQYYLPTSNIYCNRECAFDWLKNFVDKEVIKATLEYIEVDNG
jgi:hypothetical protein